MAPFAALRDRYTQGGRCKRRETLPRAMRSRPLPCSVQMPSGFVPSGPRHFRSRMKTPHRGYWHGELARTQPCSPRLSCEALCPTPHQYMCPTRFGTYPNRSHQKVLAVPNGHPLMEKKQIRLKDLVDAPFVAFPRWAIPNAYDRLMAACARGGLKAPRVVQQTAVETMILSLVQCGVGVALISSAARWRCPPGVTILPVVDLNVTFPFALMWKENNNSPLLAKLVDNVKCLVDQKGRDNEILGE